MGMWGNLENFFYIKYREGKLVNMKRVFAVFAIILILAFSYLNRTISTSKIYAEEQEPKVFSIHIEGTNI